MSCDNWTCLQTFPGAPGWEPRGCASGLLGWGRPLQCYPENLHHGLWAWVFIPETRLSAGLPRPAGWGQLEWTDGRMDANPSGLSLDSPKMPPPPPPFLEKKVLAASEVLSDSIRQYLSPR